MVQYHPPPILPTEFDLPSTDHQPLDNELHNLIPDLLRSILALAWPDRMDWFMGINLFLYYDPNQPAIGPDAFLSLGTELLRPHGKLRQSYLVWQEHNVIPQWVLEIVSEKPGKEYTDKRDKYAAMGVLYYTVYNPDYWQRDGHAPFEVYRLEQDQYVLQPGNPVWMPEVCLGIGCEQGIHQNLTQQWLYWYDEFGNRFAVPENVIQQERQRAEQERQRAEQERQRAEQERQRAEQERQRAEQAEQQLVEEQQQREKLLAQLRDRGIKLEDLEDL